MSHKEVFPPVVPRWISIKRALKFALNPIPILDQNIREYGDTYTFHIGGFFRKGIVTIDPEVIQHVLQKNHRNYVKSNIQTKILARYLGNGLLTSEGSYWLRQRRLIQPGFHRERLAGLTELMNREIAEVLDQLKLRIAKNPVVDMHEEMNRLAFRIIAKAIFSTSLSEEDLQNLSVQITVLQQFIVRQIRQPYLRPWHQVSGQLRKHEMISVKTRSILSRLIEQRLQSNIAADDLLQMLIDARYEDTGEPMTPGQILDESLILFIAGHETSANALAWTLYLLASHEGIASNLKREVHDVLGTGPATFENLRRLTYTKQIIDESLRLYPPAWIIDRVSQGDDSIKGFDIPKGTLLVLYVYGAHRNPKLWPRPEIFDPERFAEDGSFKVKPYSYFPFGGGPRLCIGNNFALMEMQLTLSQFIQRFEVRSVPEADISPLPMVTLRPKAGIHLQVISR
ncbi:MAG: cytochrome P450 [Saprospiraceae bacterium]|nr:cytochrome P450 [Saprospiraceae bacterium]